MLEELFLKNLYSVEIYEFIFCLSVDNSVQGGSISLYIYIYIYIYIYVLWTVNVIVHVCI
jgi:hypothetical protein